MYLGIEFELPRRSKLMQDHCCEVTTSRHVTNHDWPILSEGERERGGGGGGERVDGELCGIIIILCWHQLYTKSTVK